MNRQRMSDADEARQATNLLRDVVANLRTHLPATGSKHKTLRAWALVKRDSPLPKVAREAECTLACLDFLGED